MNCSQPSSLQKLLFFALLFIAPWSLQAQFLQVTGGNTPPFTPENLISNIFLGDGVEVTSIVYNGDPLAVGYFTGGTQSIGLERGIVMTSGRAASQGANIGCNDVGSQFASSNNGGNISDPDLADQTTAGIQDVAVYEITFIPTADTLRFRYVFGSEEYPEYACSPFNDVFGFFITGPNPLDPPNPYVSYNIARVPGTSLPVTINNVHPANPNYNCGPFNEQYYNNNNGTNLQPSYDGFTDIFIAEAIVVPCQEYTIKLAIADASDEVFDSGVFLEAKSFGTGSLKVELATISQDGTVTEGCSQGMLTISLPTEVTQDYPVDYNVWGTATNGVDYQTIPTNLSIVAGQSQIQIPIIAFEDNVAEGPEYIAIDVQRDPCNRDTIYIYLRENGLVPPSLRGDTSICTGGAALELDGTLPIQLPDPPTFTNTTDFQIFPTNTAIFSDLNVFGVQPVILGPGVIRSVCVNLTHVWVDDLDLYLISPGGQFLELTTDNGANGDNYTNTCFTPTASTVISSPGPFAPASAAPFTGDWLPEGVWSDLWDGDNPSNGTWRLQVVDDANGFVGYLRDWTITFEPSYKVNYQWSPIVGLDCPTCPIANATPTQSTVYHLLATDSYGCVVEDSVAIDVQLALDAPLVACTNVTSNSISFSWNAVPGASGYEVNVNGGGWVPASGATSHDVTGLAPNTTVNIEVRAIGNFLCPANIGTASCTNCQVPVVNTQAVGVSCFNGTNGAITLTPDGLNPPYTFAVASQTNNNGVFQNLAAGNYIASVTDAGGCQAQIPFNIPTPNQMTVTPTVQQQVSCFNGDNGSINATVNGGTSGYTYQWSNMQATPIASNLVAGTYIVTVTDANNCTATASATITQPTDIQLSANAVNVKCFGDSTGSGTANAVGGVQPYDFAWSSGQGGPSAPNLSAGSFTVTVTDANNCKKTTVIFVTEPSLLTADAASTDVNCGGSSDGTASVVAGGGFGNYSYQWSSGQLTANVSGLPAQTYTVTVTDANNCTATDQVTITAPEVLAVSATSNDATCYGTPTGSATATVTGGTLGYSYLWSNAQTTATAQNLPAGAYTVQITDAHNCTTTVSVTIGQPEAIALNATPTDANCFGAPTGSIDVTVTGGTNPIDYSWDSGETTEDLSGKTAGIYILTITDANNCTATIAQTINQPQGLNATLSQQNVRCFEGNDGTLQVGISGGVAGYNVSWSGPNGFSSNATALTDLLAGNYTVTVTDANNCSVVQAATLTQPSEGITISLPEIADTICFGASNGVATVVPQGGSLPYQYQWSNGQLTPTATNLGSNQYNVTVTDANNCSKTDSTFVVQKQEMNVWAQAIDPLCHDGQDGGGQVTVVYYGADQANLSDFIFSWNTSPAQNGTTAANMVAGLSYTVTAVDPIGCTASSTITIGNPPALSAQIDSSSSVRCNGDRNGWAEAKILGGVGPYTYFWNSSPSQNTQRATNLPAGTYRVTITDLNGCTAGAQVQITEPPVLAVSFTAQAVKCFGENTGSATSLASGGVSPYSYQWESGEQTANATQLSAGFAQLLLTDKNGCQLLDSIEIKQPDSLLGGTADKRDVVCFGEQDGRIFIHGAGGTPPYRYALDNKPWNGSSTQIALKAGIYVPHILDANGCTAELPPVEIEQHDPVDLDLGPDITIDLGQTTQLFAQISNALGPVIYTWSPEDSTWLSCLDCPDPFVDTLYYANSFSLHVVDSLGCEAEDRITVMVEKPRRIFVPTGFTPNGDNENDFLFVHGQKSARVLTFRVYDRWGEMLYEATDFPVNDHTTGWDGNFRGNAVDPGVYIWTLEVEYLDKTRESFKGSTNLLR